MEDDLQKKRKTTSKKRKKEDNLKKKYLKKLKTTLQKEIKDDPPKNEKWKTTSKKMEKNEDDIILIKGPTFPGIGSALLDFIIIYLFIVNIKPPRHCFGFSLAWGCQKLARAACVDLGWEKNLGDPPAPGGIDFLGFFPEKKEKNA